MKTEVEKGLASHSSNSYVSGRANFFIICRLNSIATGNNNLKYIYILHFSTTKKNNANSYMVPLFQPNKLHLGTLTSSTQLILSTTKIVYIKLCTFLKQRCIFIVYISWKNSSALLVYSIVN